MSSRKFYLNTYTVTVLSEESPLGDMITLKDLEYLMNFENCVGVTNYTQTQIDPKEVVKKLIEYGSEPSFFGLTKKGKNRKKT